MRQFGIWGGAALCALVAACASPGPETQPLQGDLLVSNVRVIDFSGEAPEERDNAFVLIGDGGVLAVAETRTGLTATVEQDASGLTMIPGLTDMHVHVWDEAELGAYLS